LRYGNRDRPRACENLKTEPSDLGIRVRVLETSNTGPRTARLTADRMPRGERAKKAPRKAHVPGGQRTQSPFRERLDAITLACGRTRGKSFRGEEALAARRGVYRSGWMASVPMPTAAGSLPPYREVDPSTWFLWFFGQQIGVTSQLVTAICQPPKSAVKFPRRLAPRATSNPSSWGGRIREGGHSGQG
jgi:hypothetical protein